MEDQLHVPLHGTGWVEQKCNIELDDLVGGSYLHAEVLQADSISFDYCVLDDDLDLHPMFHHC